MKLKLKDAAGTQTLAKVQFHARALRAIGQDLSNLFPQSLEITREGMSFRAIGRYVPRDPSGKGARLDVPLRDELQKTLPRDRSAVPPVESAPALIRFERTYTPVDIERIDEIGSNCRNRPDNTPDIYSLGEMLRMVGRIVDANGRCLLKLSRDRHGVTAEYEDGAGQNQKIELSNSQLYKLQQRYYAERGTHVLIDNWKGSV